MTFQGLRLERPTTAFAFTQLTSRPVGVSVETYISNTYNISASSAHLLLRSFTVKRLLVSESDASGFLGHCHFQVPLPVLRVTPKIRHVSLLRVGFYFRAPLERRLVVGVSVCPLLDLKSRVRNFNGSSSRFCSFPFSSHRHNVSLFLHNVDNL